MEQTLSELILASLSPRRRELLKLLGHPFRSITSSVEETSVEGESPADHVVRLSVLKAADIGGKTDQGIVIGCDTVVVLDACILEKPESPTDAVEMLMKLQGRIHTVFTGYAMINASSGKKLTGFDTTRVQMRHFSQSTAERYVSTDEPLDKAGSYGIQGFGSVLVKSIEGCYFNVMGLPLPKIMEALYTFTDGDFGYFGNRQKKGTEQHT